MITSFRDKYHFLSNFYHTPLTWEGDEYPTIEHAFQAAKTDHPEERRRLRETPSPLVVKRLGRKVTLRSDWEQVKLDIMADLLRQKFTRYPDLRDLLLATGDLEIIEGNTWDDRFYGAVWDETEQRWIGENHLGKILMRIREELRSA
ncbi:MAG: NADAR family protein [Anaerolineae bacterium]|nr:NADAR family protein [Anaerolineae bacterium]